MSGNTHPTPVLSGTTRWLTPDGNHLTVVTIANERSRVFVGPNDLPALAQAVLTALEASEQQGGTA